MEKVKHDWYQTESDVILAVLLKHAKPEDVTINFEDRLVSVHVRQSNHSEYQLELNLLHCIKPNQSSWKCLPSKIEVKMRKCEGLRWDRLEGDPPPDVAETLSCGDQNGLASKSSETGEVAPTASSSAHHKQPTPIGAYPTSSLRGPKNWDKIAAEAKKEEEAESLEGDAAVNQLFQKIYADASDENRRAMVKSFVESRGTVLSTNWNEVGKEEVECKPPDGMEWKKYD